LTFYGYSHSTSRELRMFQDPGYRVKTPAMF
jgi:hypothetical protein